ERIPGIKEVEDKRVEDRAEGGRDDPPEQPPGVGRCVDRVAVVGIEQDPGDTTLEEVAAVWPRRAPVLPQREHPRPGGPAAARFKKAELLGAGRRPEAAGDRG